jgi:hypothetical protein
VTVSGRLGLIGENGTYYGQTATNVEAYWNLDFRKWWSALEASPLSSVRGSPVKLLGRQDVAKRCGYRVRITIPRVRPGRYPIEVLSGKGKSRGSFAPADFRVTSR